MALGKTGRGAGAGVGDYWVKPRDWELGDHTGDCMNFVVLIPNTKTLINIPVSDVVNASCFKGAKEALNLNFQPLALLAQDDIVIS